MFAKLKSCCLAGIDGFIVDIEIDIRNGIPAFEICGLADITVRESKERVKSAIKNSNFDFPIKKIIINLAPANLKKVGTQFDLGIAIGVLMAAEVVKNEAEKWIVIGELSLDGNVKPVNGVLPLVSSCSEIGYKNIIVPYDNLYEALAVKNMNIIGVKSLDETVGFLNGQIKIDNGDNFIDNDTLKDDKRYENDMSEVKGQKMAKRALEISAAGNHSMLMIGAPGSGKTMLAKRLPTILPDMTYDEAIEVTKIYSIVGYLSQETPVITRRPFRDPHHTISGVSLIGGGKYPQPGEISLANNGVLFLDELPEFRKETLDVLRQPIEAGHVNITRLAGRVKFPANVLLICAANPCKCGFYLDKNNECKCSQYQINNYLSKLSGPLLDRIDLQVEIAQVKYDEIYSKSVEETSKDIRLRVNNIRKIQRDRYKDINIRTNSQLNSKYLKKYCNLNKSCQEFIKIAFDSFKLSVRAHDKIIKIARTIADLDNCDNIAEKHLAEAMQYRCLDRKLH